MAKRFIDTEIFNDEWFSELSKDCKLFFIYYITNCDHAGVLKFNKKLCEFQTGINSSERLIEELGNSLVRVKKESTYFMPKFIEFQYPDFPKSNVKQQDSAIKILKTHGFWNEKSNSYLTLQGQLPKTYDNVSDNVNENDNANVSVCVSEKNISNQGEIFSIENKHDDFSDLM